MLLLYFVPTKNNKQIMSEQLIKHLGNVLLSQIQFNPELKADSLYDEFINTLTGKGYGDYQLCEKLTDFQFIEKSENLQYLIDNKNKRLAVINKFF